jgi:hypothetical protein
MLALSGKNKLRILSAYVQNDKGAALLATLAISFVVMALGINYFKKSEIQTSMVENDTGASQAFYNAQTGIHWGIRRMVTGTTMTTWLPQPMSLLKGQVEARMDFDNVDDRAYIVARGSSGVETRTLRVEALMMFKLPGVRGAAALYGPRDIYGGVEIDGRNHALDGSYNGTDDGNTYEPGVNGKTEYYGSGKYGVYTDGAFTIHGNSGAVGGTQEVVPGEIYSDWAPVNSPIPPGGIYESATDLPRSPDDAFIDPDTGENILGMTLKERAMALGSFYSTDPAYWNDGDSSTTFLGDQATGAIDKNDITNRTFNLKAVTWIELTSEVEFQNTRSLWGPTFNASGITEGSAIVVIVSKDIVGGMEVSAGNAVLAHYSGTYKGLMITENIEKLSGDLLGATIVTDNTATNQNASDALGGGNATIKYSSKALARIIRDACPDCAPQKQTIVLWVEDNRERNSALQLVDQNYYPYN